jgi:predicted permease
MTDWKREIVDRLTHLSLRPEREAEIVEELSQHLDDQVRERIAGGMDPEQARGEALASLDTPDTLGVRLREVEAGSGTPLVVPGAPPIGVWFSQVWQDIRLAFRTLRRRPWISISALATLALTIGPTTAIVSIGNWLLWTPSRAVTEPDRLVVIWTGQWRGVSAVSPRGLSYLNLADVRSSARTLAGIAGWQEMSLSLAAPGRKPRATQGGFVTANFFDVLGIRLAAGRSFRPEEDRPPFGTPVAVISSAFARDAFGLPEQALGKSVLLNGRPMTVIGVVPSGFDGAAPTSVVDVWYPGAAYPYVNHFPEQSARRYLQRADGIFYTFIGRLAPGMEAGAAQAELDATLPSLVTRYPEENEDFKTVQARVYAGLGPRELQRPQLTRLVDGLLIVAGVLLLLGCANLSNLLVSEGVRTRREHAVRLALGASRGRLIRQLLTQSTVISIAGSALGIGLAFWLKQSIQLWMLPGIELQPVAPSVPLDRVVLAVTLATAIACGLLAGVAPAWLGTRVALRRGLAREASRHAMYGQRARTVLAAAQFALSLALVTGTILMVGTLRHLSRVDLGFAVDGVAIQTLSLRTHGYTPDRVRAYTTELVARVRADPNVASATLASAFPFGYTRIQRVQRPGASPRDGIDARSVSTDERFPDVFGLRLLHGRYLRADEVLKPQESGSPVVVSEALARALYGRVNVVGERITLPRTLAGPSRDFTIVGVMRDTRTNSLTEDGDPLLYRALSDGEDFTSLQSVLATRSPLPLATVGAAIERSALQLDPTLPIGPTRSLRQWIDRTIARNRVFANVLLLLSTIGVLLAGIGLYGLLAQTVGERQRELGIRMVIGARARHVAAVVATQAGWIAAVGMVAGLVLASWGARLVKAYVVGVSESDPRVYALTAGFLLTVTAIAAARPVWTATRVNPVETLRAE